MRALSDYLAKEFAARGVPPLLGHAMIDGKQSLFFPPNHEIVVSPFASDAEISTAVFKAFHMTDDNIETAKDVPPTSDKIPAVELAAAADKPKTSKPIPAGSHPPGTLAALLQGLKDRKALVMDGAVTEAKRAHKALDQVEKVTGDMTATTDGIMSELGAFTNFPDE